MQNKSNLFCKNHRNLQLSPLESSFSREITVLLKSWFQSFAKSSLEFVKDIAVSEISADLVRDIPINYAKTQGVLPCREENEALWLLTSNPINSKAIDDLRTLFGKRVKPLVTTTQKLQDAINRVYEKSTGNLS